MAILVVPLSIVLDQIVNVFLLGAFVLPMNKSKISNTLLFQIIKEKHLLLPDIMKENDMDCWIIFVRETPSNPDPIMNLLVGGDVVWKAAFIFSISDGKFKKTVILGEGDSSAEKRKGIWDEVIGYVKGISETLKTFIDKLNPTKIALNYSLDDVVSDGLSHGMYLNIERILGEHKKKFISSKPLVHAVRGRKTKTEIELVQKACELTEEINKKMAKQFKIGVSETQIQEMFFKEMENLGVEEAWQRNCCPAIDAGPDKEIGHDGPREDLFTQKGHTLHNDFGVRLNGYCSDIQRMWFFGTEDEIPDELIHAFNTVRDAIQKAADYIKPGVTGHSVDTIARNHVISQGYPEYGHALGHQVGTEGHDGGVLLGPLWEKYGDIPKGLVEENNIFTLELEVVTKNYGTVSLEEDVVITKDGCRFLVPPQTKFITL
ncbi:Methionine aminopeptidase 1, mitochondrial [Candidatus Lokiarchaeum ossiferum]|uniref:Methionine aminopeptidase 1, mitochondrial n=1 Tax=Candidatus Lokiarchaeum ossiferum TaxID=2951803 RepID=A0ABY6HXT1_9ARCH|nr:Methionine aminopeptidase 1, mitochondrial [Candidatus Lokiarchaeum sp. B-35]